MTHVFLTVVMRFHLLIANMNFPVLWRIPYSIFTAWSCVYNVQVILENSRSSLTAYATVAIVYRVWQGVYLIIYICTLGACGASTDRSCLGGELTRPTQCRWLNLSSGCGYWQVTLPRLWKQFVARDIDPLLSLLKTDALSRCARSACWNLCGQLCRTGWWVEPGRLGIRRYWVRWGRIVHRWVLVQYGHVILLWDWSRPTWRFLDLISKLVEHFKGRFATDGIDVSSLEEGLLVINRSSWWMTSFINLLDMLYWVAFRVSSSINELHYVMLGRFNRLILGHFLVVYCGSSRIDFRESTRDWVPGIWFNKHISV